MGMTLESLEHAIHGWLSQGATDVFLSEGEVPRVRANGELVGVEMPALDRADLETLWVACRASVDSERDRDVRLQMGSGGYLRVNLYRTMDKLAAAIRPIKDEIPQLDTLGVPVDLVRRWTQPKLGNYHRDGRDGIGKIDYDCFGAWMI